MTQLTGSFEDALRQALACVAAGRRSRIVDRLPLAGGAANYRTEPYRTRHRYKLLLGERPFMTRRGPSDVLAQPGEDAERLGPSEAVDWYGFLDRPIPVAAAHPRATRGGGQYRSLRPPTGPA